jgi:hypothetical protein
LLRALLAVAIAASCAVLATGVPWAETFREQSARVAAIVGGALALVAAIAWATKLFSTRPTLEIDSVGIVDHASVGAAGRVQWSEIASVHIYVLNGQRFLAIVPVDPLTFLWHESAAKGLGRRLAAMTVDGLPVIAIPEATVSLRLEALVAEMARHAPRLVVTPERHTRTTTPHVWG